MRGLGIFAAMVHQTLAGFQKHIGLDDIDMQEVVC
jgi:hypothetical protein